MAEPRAAGRTRRTTGAGASPRRRSGARRHRAVPKPASGRRIGWSRRVGVSIALVALGGSIVLAGTGALTGVRDRPAPSLPGTGIDPIASADPSVATTLAAPSIEGPVTALTRQATWSLTVAFSTPVTRRRDATLVVYRAERIIARRPVRRGTSMRIADIPLRNGDNVLSVAIGGPQESARSAPVTITRDDVAPLLRVSDPRGAGTVNSDSVTVRGTTEAGSQVTVRNETSTDSAAQLVGSAGSFELEVGLDRGVNRLIVRARDEAGNVAGASVSVTRGDGQPLARLMLSDAVFRRAQLPATISIEVAVLDADGVPVNDAAVVFSLSPPGLPTQTFRTTTSDGAAAWSSVTLLADGAVVGRGFATVQVTLDDGSVVRESATFEFR